MGQSSIDTILLWSTAALTSAERVLGLETASPWAAERSPRPERIRQADAALMVFAMRNILRAAEWAGQSHAEYDLPKVHEALEEFHRAVPDLIDARNALEHFDEYAHGRGRRQRTHPGEYSISLTERPRPSVLIGPLRVDVERSRDACRSLVIRVLAAAESAVSANE